MLCPSWIENEKHPEDPSLCFLEEEHEEPHKRYEDLVKEGRTWRTKR